MSETGENLIFLISLPRSGSTLLQHVIGSHSLVHTVPEPWLMLPIVYSFRPVGIETDYNARIAYLAMRDTFSRLVDGEDVYIEAVRKMASHLYSALLAPSEKAFFLDKCTRYYLIIPDLLKIFPDARYIILLRNPLAVLSSVVETVFNGNLARFSDLPRRKDLLDGPHHLLQGVRLLGDKAAIVHYESLVKYPIETVRSVCDKLGIEFEPGMINYGDKVRFSDTTFVDQKSIYRHQRPVEDYLCDWTEYYDNSQRIYFDTCYLESIGEDTLKGLGYSYCSMLDILSEAKSNRKLFASPWKRIVIPWRFIMSENEREIGWKHRALSFACILATKGLWEVLRRAYQYAIRTKA